MTIFTGGCHCQRVRFEVEGPLTRVMRCNCSICTKKGFLHWIVAPARFHLLTSPSELSSYRFHTRVAEHQFCSTCGVAPFYTPRSDPDKIDVNVRCLDGVDLDSLVIETFDGQNWEEAHRRYREAP